MNLNTRSDPGALARGLYSASRRNGTRAFLLRVVFDLPFFEASSIIKSDKPPFDARHRAIGIGSSSITKSDSGIEIVEAHVHQHVKIIACVVDCVVNNSVGDCVVGGTVGSMLLATL